MTILINKRLAVKALTGYFKSIYESLQFLVKCLLPIFSLTSPFLPFAFLWTISSFSVSPFLGFLPSEALFPPPFLQPFLWLKCVQSGALSAPPLCDMRPAQPITPSGFITITNL